MIRYRRLNYIIPAGLIVLCGFFFGLISGCDQVRVSKYFENGAVVTSAPIATEIGVDVFNRGGNAFDVAVAVGFALAVVDPEAGNIGGGGFAVIRDGRTGTVRSLDFRETAPMAATETMFLDDSGRVIDNLSLIGAKSAGVPGTVAGLYELWQQHGSMPWEELVRISADLADSGFVVDELLAVSLARHVDDLKRYPETARLFLPTGAPPQAGDRFVQEDLARSLYQIAAEGPEVFYEGEIAAQIDSTMQTYDGLITLEDLAAYEPIWREPVHFRFDSLDIYSMALPSSGGLVLGQILEILEPYAFDQYTPDSPGYIRLFAEASRLAFADRSVHMGDPAFYDVPGGLLDSAYLAQRRSLIPESGAGSSSQIGPGTPLRSESPQTTHFSVCDREGNMVALTYTLNGSFGSGVTVIDGGFLLNNEMDDFSIKPGVPNQFGLVGGEANKIEPGKRMLSSMTPTLVLQHGE
ncbi:gamma-glutamyltransferase, partial [candidate division GN15 bacterium]|nr:gamma-glutamyltransferase [candidate division GN15 bacterium]